MAKRIAIFGLGFLGGSICKSIRKSSSDTELIAYGRDARRLDRALDEGIVDSVDIISNASLKNVDFVVVSMPVIISLEVINDILNNSELEESTIIVDVGSVKEAVIRDVEGNRRADRFIGCHPMAGSEKIGFENSSDELFDNAFVFITPHRYNIDKDIERVRDFWEMLNAKTIVLPAELHDSIIAYTSHLPHIVACALVDLYKDIATSDSHSQGIDKKDIIHFIGSGFRDTTRVSSGSVDIWTDIILLNSMNIYNSLKGLIEKLQSLLEILDAKKVDDERIRSFFETVRNYRLGLK